MKRKLTGRFRWLLRTGALFCVLAAPSAAFAQFMDVYIGTSTRPGQPGGIYSAQFDPQTGKWQDLRLAAEVTNPTFLALSPNGRNLYAAIETDPGAVQAFRVGAERTLTFLNQELTGGSGTCHVSVTAEGTAVLSADYGSGSVAVFPVQAEGALSPRSDERKFTGSGPNPRRQKQSYGHAFNALGAFAYACDLGSDQIWSFRLENGRLTPLATPAGKVAPGSGPRHLAFSPNGKFAFVVNELIPGVTVFSRDLSSGELLAKSTLAALAPEAVTPAVTSAEIVLHSEGRWLYVSNRGDNSVTLFSVDADGGLKVVETVSAGVKSPRSIAIDPSGKWLLAAGQGDSRVTVFSIDQTNGRLKPTDSVLEVPRPVCLQFAPGFSS